MGNEWLISIWEGPFHVFAAPDYGWQNERALSQEGITQPNWRTGLEIFITRPLSLVAVLILAVILCVISWMLLLLPAIAAYYFAVKHSRKEEYFIDLNSIFRTAGLFLRGIPKYFIQSYILGLTGLLPAVILFYIPVVPLMVAEDQTWAYYASLALSVLWIPALFLAGVTVFNGYPRLIVTNSGIDAIRYAISEGKTKPPLALARGFLLLSPIPGWIFHFMMVLSYPWLTAWAIATTNDIDELEKHGKETEGISMFSAVGLTLGLAAVMFGACFLFVGLWHTAGFVIWLIFSFVLVFLFVPRITAKTRYFREQ